MNRCTGGNLILRHLTSLIYTRNIAIVMGVLLMVVCLLYFLVLICPIRPSVVFQWLRSDSLAHWLNFPEKPRGRMSGQLGPFRRQSQRVGSKIGVEIEASDTICVPHHLILVFRSNQL